MVEMQTDDIEMMVYDRVYNGLPNAGMVLAGVTEAEDRMQVWNLMDSPHNVRVGRQVLVLLPDRVRPDAPPQPAARLGALLDEVRLR